MCYVTTDTNKNLKPPSAEMRPSYNKQVNKFEIDLSHGSITSLSLTTDFPGSATEIFMYIFLIHCIWCTF